MSPFKRSPEQHRHRTSSSWQLFQQAPRPSYKMSFRSWSPLEITSFKHYKEWRMYFKCNTGNRCIIFLSYWWIQCLLSSRVHSFITTLFTTDTVTTGYPAKLNCLPRTLSKTILNTQYTFVSMEKDPEKMNSLSLGSSKYSLVPGEKPHLLDP